MEHFLTLFAQTWTVVWVVPVAAGMVATGFFMDKLDRRAD
jgi:hypothetical protein